MMMMKGEFVKKVVTMLFLLIAIFISGCDIAGPDEGSNLNLMPLSENNSWKYDGYEYVENVGLDYKETITMSLGPPEYFNYNGQTLRGYPVSNENSYILKNDDGIFEYVYDS